MFASKENKFFRLTKLRLREMFFSADVPVDENNANISSSLSQAWQFVKCFIGSLQSHLLLFFSFSCAIKHCILRCVSFYQLDHIF